MPFVVGIDGGTESLRAAVFDLSGTPISISTFTYETSYPSPSWAEQNPSDWWDVGICCSLVLFLLILNEDDEEHLAAPFPVQ